ncbi:uncharacterized protein LOC131681105 [Topomyia yanbarensis]|uniref:uncharacterized protein LOC131681105 n=1 Tax=Topomyia yanbarensis TaxID=2498891 RepID=UPI00273C24E5|nr:uncharacterized protein LOC131681105 [Topomyia yanbarensis]
MRMSKQARKLHVIAGNFFKNLENSDELEHRGNHSRTLLIVIVRLTAMNRKVWTCVILLCVTFFHPTCADDARPYFISYEETERYSETDSNLLNYGTMRVYPKSRNVFIIGGNFEVFQDMDNSYMTKYEIYSGDDEQPMMVGSTGICEALNIDNRFVDRLRMISNLPAAGTCPFPKGAYFVDNYILEESQLPPSIPEGSYIFAVKLFKDSVLKAGYKVYVAI